MSATLPAGLYQPGTTVLHRLPVGVKLAGLAVLSLAIVAVRSMPAAFGFLAVALLLALVARLPLAQLVRSTRSVLILAVIAGAVQWWFYGRDKAVETFLDLLTLAIAALIVTATTPVNAMLDAVIRWITPFARFGAKPDKVALTFALTVSSLPGTFTLAMETRDAARARGVGRHPRAYLTPFVIRVIARAHETGDALQARGIGDED